MSGKTIQINPEYLAMANGKSKKQKTQKRPKKQKPAAPKLPNKMRKELLGRIKDFQKNKEQELAEVHVQDAEEEDFENEFNRSLSFLQDLSTRKNRKGKKSNKQGTLRREDARVSVDAPRDMFEIATAPLEEHKPLPEVSLPPPAPEVLETTENTPPHSPSPRPIPPPSSFGEQPPYGSLKNGTRPTFREWKRHTQKSLDSNANARPLIKIDDNEFGQAPKSEREKKLERFKAKIKPRTSKASRIKTLKYRLGKLPDRRVAVLIKNKATRKQVQSEHGALKTQSILEVKNYLRRKNLLKAGSNAPADVLRQMYEQSILAGDVENTSRETLMHNFFSETA